MFEALLAPVAAPRGVSRRLRTHQAQGAVVAQVGHATALHRSRSGEVGDILQSKYLRPMWWLLLRQPV